MDDNQFNQVSSNDQINQLNQINQVSESSSQKGNSDSKLPVIIIVILLIAGGVVAGYYFGTQVEKDNKCVAETTNKDEKKDDSNKVINNESIKEETKEVIKAGTDTNTSGKKIINTQTKNVVLNDVTYEVKIEMLEPSKNNKPADDKIPNQNIYINGYKFVNDEIISYCEGMCYSHDSENSDIIDTNNKYVTDTLNNLKVIKDKENGKEYLALTKGFYKSLIIVDAKGKKIGELSNKPGYGVEIYTNEKPLISNSRVCDSAERSCDKKYILYYFDSEISIESDYVLQLNGDEINKMLEECLDISSLTEYKYVIKNGEFVKDVNKVYKTSDGYEFNGVGQCG